MSRTSSPTSVDTARRLARYNRRVFSRYAASARKLPWRTATANRQTGHLSIFQTLVHILNVHEVWMLYIVQGRTRELAALFRESGRRPKSWIGFDAYAGRVWAGIEAFMETLTPTVLSRKVKAPWMPGRYTVGDGILQTTFEQAHHLGEIIAIFWRKNREPPPMTWIDVNRTG